MITTNNFNTKETLMRTCLIPVLALFMFLSVAVAPTQASVLYTVNGFEFGKIDTTTRVYTQIAADAAFGNIRGNLAYNSGNDTFYTTVRVAGGQFSSDTNLATITRAGVVSAGYGPAKEQLLGLSFGPGGSPLSAITYDPQLQTIDPVTGVRSNIGYTAASPSFPGGAVYVGGSLYVAGVDSNTFNSSLMRLDAPATDPTYSVVADNSLFDGMLLAWDGSSIYGINSQNDGKLYQINPVDGAITDLGAITGGVPSLYGIAYAPDGPATVPEPSTYALLVIGLGVVGYARRKMVKSEE
jgi:hypothetical protein